MRINDIFESSTSSGSIAVVAAPLGGTRARAEVGKGVYTSKGKVGSNLLTGKASKKKYANSVGVNESVTLKFHTVDLRPDQFHWYTKNYYDEYNIESHYGNFLHNLKALAHTGHKINESKEFDAVQPFIDAINRVGTKKTIKIDDMFAVLAFEIIYLDELINVRGFTVPKKITQIKKHPDGTINYIRFDDGTRYPRISKATAGNRQFEYAAYFDSETDADHALTILGLMIPNNWEVSTADLNKQWPMYGLKEDNMKIAEMFNGVTEEASRLEEDDFILVPGKGNKLKTGLHSFDPDKAEHEGETLKNSLRTIVRVASDLNKRLDDQDNFPEWVSEKVGAIKSMMTGVMQYLASEQEADHAELGEFGAGVIAGGGVGEGVDAGKLHPMQKTINFAKKNGYEVKISQKGTQVSFYNPRYDHSVKTSIYKDGEELWVNFHDEDSGMSGNDPIGDFYGTFANAVDRNGMYADDSEEDDDLDEGALNEIQGVYGNGGNKKNLKIIHKGVVVKDYGTDTKPNKASREKTAEKMKAYRMYADDSEEDDDLDEGVETDTRQYKISHGKEPKGRGGWYFSPHSAIDFAKHKEGDDYISSGNDSYGDAKKQAAQWAKSKGHKKMYVLPEGAKVDRMVRHIKSSEKKSGKSDKEAESIAFATLNKRGMLDNANKKKGK